MALSALIEWDVRTTGNDNNGGGYKAGATGTDYSQQDSPQYALTAIASAGAGDTILSASAANDMVGNVAQVISGTNFTTGFFEVLSVSVGVSITFSTNSASASICTGVGASGVINIGGAVATLGKVSVTTAAVAGNKIWIKSVATLTVTITITCIGSLGSEIIIAGYGSTHGDNTRVGVTSATNSVALFTLNNADFTQYKNFSFTHTAATRGIGISGITSESSPVTVENCIFDGCSIAINGGAQGLATITINNCEVKNSTSGGISMGRAGSVRIFACDIHDNSGVGIVIGSNAINLVIISNIIDTNTFGIQKQYTGSSPCADVIFNNIIVDNTQDGIEIASASNASLFVANNIFYGNSGGFGFDDNRTTPSTYLNRNNAYGSNSSGALDGLAAGTGDVTLSADPFTNRTSRDFSLNNTAGGGTACRTVGYPGVFISSTTTSYRDIGAAQHQDNAVGRSRIIQNIGTY